MSSVALQQVTKRFGAQVVLNNVSLEVPSGAFLALVGPSGSGKTTLLRVVGGFEKPDSGAVLLGGMDLTALPPQVRPTAMVFQNYALFPTMTVWENVAYGLRARKHPRASLAGEVAAALRRVGLEALEARPVTQLSGGQQQRVAVARALAVKPAILLYDEPLSNLDPALRAATRHEIRTLHQQLGTTALYVTHDKEEALALADLIAVMRDGELVEVGPPETLYRAPRTAFVATFLGGAELVPGDAPLGRNLGGSPPSARHQLAVRPEQWVITQEDVPRSVEARLVSRTFLGREVEWTFETYGERTFRTWRPVDARVMERFRVHAPEARWVEP